MLVAIVALISCFFIFDLKQYLTLEYIKSEEANIVAYRIEHPFGSGFLFAFLYIIFTGLSIPGAVMLALASGAIFGLLIGTLISSFAFSLGSTLAFLSSRFLFRDTLQARYSQQLKVINDGLESEGIFYLFTLRMLPILPYFVFNLLTGLTKIKVWTFYWITQLGTLASVIICVHAGTQLAKIESLKDILTPNLILSFALLGVFPLLIKKILQIFKNRQKV